MRVTTVLFPLLITASLALSADRVAVPLENSPSRGPENAPITIIEFIDFQ